MFLSQVAEYMFPHSNNRSTLHVHNSYTVSMTWYLVYERQSHHVTWCGSALESGVRPVFINSHQLVFINSHQLVVCSSLQVSNSACINSTVY